MTTPAAAKFPDREPRAWHAMSVHEVIAALDAHHNGLSAEEAARRLRIHGPNRLPEMPPRHPVIRFLLQFHSVLIYVLLAAAVVTAAIGHVVDSAVILAVVVINAIVGFVQEGRAEQAMGAIRAMLAPKALVLRDGHRMTVDAADLVPGDVVVLEAGDRVPADLRLLHAKSVEVDEAPLTGESLPVAKSTAEVPPETLLADRTDMAYFGTLLTRGTASGLVVATGEATEIGRIGHLVGSVGRITTPLLRQMDRFAHWLTFTILAVSAAIFAFGVLVRGYDVGELFLAVVGLAVAAIPEGLPAILTITMAIGVERMAHRNAIVRHLPAVETLGSVTVICSDKTGTLTRNEMTVETVAVAGTVFDVEGSGYLPEGDIRDRDGAAGAEARRARLRELVRGACLCSDAQLRQAGGGWRVEGDPMEGALVVLAHKAGIEPARDCAPLPRIDTLPFETTRRMMATLHRDDSGGVIYAKGAPEVLLGLCDRQADPAGESDLDIAWWHDRLEEMAAEGQRVLAVAFRRTAPDKAEITDADLEAGLTMLGLLGIADPPREEAIEAVRRCRAAGIRVKMITGDHGATARAIAVRFGMAADRVVTGRDFETLDLPALARMAREVDVFARTAPEHKLRLVEALQSCGEVVAMTGDGVNDAPALKRADVGVAMGIKGSEAAREAAQIVLADDNFASIAHAVEEGRTVYQNLKKAIVFILPTNGGQALIVIGAILLGLALPVTPLQILWVNMVTTVTLALAFAFEPAEPGTMARPPRRPDAPILSPFLIWRIVLVSLLMTAAAAGLFAMAADEDGSLDRARTLAVNAIVACEALYLFNTRQLVAPSLTWRTFTGSVPAVVAVALVALLQIAFTYLPPLQTVFATVPLDIADWLWIGAAAAAMFLIVEAEKAVARRRRA